MPDKTIMEELEFLLKIRDHQSIGVSYHDEISIDCGRFENNKETGKIDCGRFENNKETGKMVLKARIEITMSKFTHEEEGRYFESMFYNTKLPEAINKAIIIKFKEDINTRIKELREKARDVLGIPEQKQEKIIGDIDTEGGTAEYEIDNKRN